MSRWKHSRETAGFTLLEVLLTLSMSVVLLVLVGGAVQFYGRDMVNVDQEARQTQLAAAVMQMIEDDLRAALHQDPIDTSGLEQLLSSLGAQAAGGGGSNESADTTSANASSTTTGMTEPVNLMSGTAMLQQPGLIGNQSQLQIDVSRIPRLEEYVAMFDTQVGTLDDIPSDLKTVTYFVQPAGVAGGVVEPVDNVTATASVSTSGGLVRRSLDRAATSYAMLMGNISALNQTGDLLAPEVTGIEFAYWDGVTWQIEWSTDQFGELPLAVRVTLSLGEPQTAQQDPTTSVTSTEPDSVIRTFQHLIRLPMARPMQLQTTMDTTTGSGI